MTTPSICIVNPPWDKELTIIPNCACHITRIKTWLSSHTSFCCTFVNINTLVRWFAKTTYVVRITYSYFSPILNIKIFSYFQCAELFYLFSALKSFYRKGHNPCKISYLLFPYWLQKYHYIPIQCHPLSSGFI